MAKSSIGTQIDAGFTSPEKLAGQVHNLRIGDAKKVGITLRGEVGTHAKNVKTITVKRDHNCNTPSDSPVHYHLPALRIRNADDPPGMTGSKKPLYHRSTSADQGNSRNDPRLLSPVINSLKKKDVNLSVSDSALHVGGTSITTNPLDPFRKRSSSTSLTQTKGFGTPKISIDKCPEKTRVRAQVNASTSFPLSNEPSNLGNLTPPVDRSSRFPRSISGNFVSPTCKCDGLHAKNCALRAVSRSMENISAEPKCDLRSDARFARLRSSLFPASYPSSAPGSPKNYRRHFGNWSRSGTESPGSPTTLESPIIVRKSLLLPRGRSKSANNIRQSQIGAHSPLRRRGNPPQTLPKLKLSVQEFDNDYNDGSLYLHEKSADLPNDGSLLAPDRMQIRSPPLTDYATEW